MKKFILLATILPLFSAAQNVLKPSIGLANQPSNNDSICPVPWYLGSFDNSGLETGDTASDFKLYSLHGDSFSLSEKLNHKHPVLLVAGSYTCPVFRNKLQVLNSIAATYSGQIEFAIIYTVEAHPIDTSPYFGYVNITQFNQSEGILYHQPVNYGERKTICADLLQNMTVNVPVYLDGPCNEWWSTFGPAPNNAYLIDTNGIVFTRHGWFDRHPDFDIVCDIDSLLGNGGCGTASTGGIFSVQMLDSMVSGQAGEVLLAHASVINNSSSPVNIGVKKTLPNLPANWEASFCYEVCFSPTDDSVTIQIGAHDTVDFSVDFFTTAPLPDSGSMKVGFRNIDNLSNAYALTFRAFTTAVSASIKTAAGDKNNIHIFPNPSASAYLHVIVDATMIGRELEFYDVHGLLVEHHQLKSSKLVLPTGQFSPGIYFIRSGNLVRKWVKQ